MFGRICTKPGQRDKSWIKYTPVECQINRMTRPTVSLALPLEHMVWTHNGCSCNQYMALRYRHQVKTPQPEFDQSAVVEIYHRLLQQLQEHLQPFSRGKVVSTYEGAWRAKYFQAQQTYHSIGLHRSQARVRMFVKDDFEMGFPSKAPRAIQFRNPIYALEMARFTKPIEKWFYKLQDRFGTNIIGKSDSGTIARTLCEKSKHFSNPIYLMLDASKFDSCVDQIWLKLNAEFYQKLFSPTWSRKIFWLWKHTFVNYGGTNKGISFKTHGTRMSGDMDTGLGNSIIMYIMLTVYLERVTTKYSILVNGDDSLVVVEADALEQLKDLTIFKEFGFNMKFEYTDNIHHAEFCQSRMIYTDYGPMMARNPARIMGRTGWITRLMSDRNCREFVASLGRCERAASWGVPIASIMANHMIALSPNSPISKFLNIWRREQYEGGKILYRAYKPTISLGTRLSFAEAWGLTPDEQIKYEEAITVQPGTKISPAQWSDYNYYVNCTAV